MQDISNTLNHLAIIMDGNGRWAKNRALPRTEGHKEGANAVREITKWCAKNHIQYLTLYAFSTENWLRPKKEVDFLMRLLEKYLKNEERTYSDNNIRFKAIGDISAFSPKLRDLIVALELKTAQNTALTQILALNYGAKDEAARAIMKMIDSRKTRKSATPSLRDSHESIAPSLRDLAMPNRGNQKLNELSLQDLASVQSWQFAEFANEVKQPSTKKSPKSSADSQKSKADILAEFESALDTANIPPVDLLIRTGGEMRLSNFLLYQCAYAELYFSKTLFPDFKVAELERIIVDFKSRHRRFGEV